MAIEKTPTPAKQTPAVQPRSQSPRKVPSPKVTAAPEPTNHVEVASKVPTIKRPISPPEQSALASPKITPTAVKSEEKSKKAELIPKFHFPNGQVSTNDVLLAKQLKQAKEEFFVPKNDKLRLEDFGKLAQVLFISTIFM